MLIPAPNGFIDDKDPGEPGRNEPRWSVNLIEARVGSELFRGLYVLEIGTGLGVATKEIAKRAKYVHTVDIDEWVKKTIVPELPENVTFYDNIKNVPVGLDAAFIDGYHSYEQCTKDIVDARRIVKQDGLFVLHDTNMDAIRKAVKESGMEIIAMGTRAGMALCWNK